MPTRKLTADEAIALSVMHNLADAHARQDADPVELDKVVRRLDSIFHEAAAMPQGTADWRGIDAYFRLSKQTVPKDKWCLATYAASISMEIVANVLRAKSYRIGLVEPTFDNIADILKRHGVSLASIFIRPGTTYLEGVVDGLRHMGDSVDALFIVNPNNPTGHTFDQEQLEALCGVCKDRGLALLIDSSFRLFDERTCFDQYAILHRCDIPYISIEDTGKVWPNLDLKLSYLRASDTFKAELEDVHHDFLLNVSPFISLLVEAYSELYLTVGTGQLRSLIDRNRRVLRERLSCDLGVIEIPFADSQVSVEVLSLPAGSRSRTVVMELARYNVSVLSGEAFHWSDPRLGERYMRVALARSPDYFDRGIDALTVGLKEILKRRLSS